MTCFERRNPRFAAGGVILRLVHTRVAVQVNPAEGTIIDTAGTRKYVEADLGQTPEYRAYAERMSALLEQEWPLVDEHELDPPNITLTPAAKQAWITLYDDIETADEMAEKYSERYPHAYIDVHEVNAN